MDEMQPVHNVDFGDECTPEKVKYNFEEIEGEIICTDNPGTCRHSLCECDKFQVTSLKESNLLEQTNSDYLAHKGFVAEEQCVIKNRPKQAIKPEPGCCGEYPNRLPYNKNARTCCDGKITGKSVCEASSFN